MIPERDVSLEKYQFVYSVYLVWNRWLFCANHLTILIIIYSSDSDIRAFNDCYTLNDIVNKSTRHGNNSAHNCFKPLTLVQRLSELPVYLQNIQRIKLLSRCQKKALIKNPVSQIQIVLLTYLCPCIARPFRKIFLALKREYTIFILPWSTIGLLFSSLDQRASMVQRLL